LKVFEETFAVNYAELDGHDISLCTVLCFAKSPVRSQLKSQLRWVVFDGHVKPVSHIRIHKYINGCDISVFRIKLVFGPNHRPVALNLYVVSFAGLKV